MPRATKVRTKPCYTPDTRKTINSVLEHPENGTQHDKIALIPGLQKSTSPGNFLIQENIVKIRKIQILILGLVLIWGLAACQPAEQVVDPAEIEAVQTELEEEKNTLDAIYPPVSDIPIEPIKLANAITTDSGLQFLEEVAGEGPLPTEGDIVNMNFIATLGDGTEIGNSYSQGGPVQAVMGRDQLLPGWEEGVMMMNAGSKARMVLPPALAFGEEGYGMIPPNAEVMLVVEIISIEAAPKPLAVEEGDLIKTDSGLKYYDITEGDGVEVQNGYNVATHFTIWVQGVADDVFVGTSIGNTPISFVVGNGDVVFPGWEEGVVGMKVGGERYLEIPPELAMGELGAGDIPPNATLVMEIKLTDANKPVAQTEVDPADYIETESGLKYYDIVEGDGATPAEGQTVVVHYSGWLEDGTKFDSSVDRGQPFTFQLGMGMVIPGWDEGVASMKVGGKRQLYIPASLGYGETGAGIIPPGATLIFDVELLEVIE